jgi:beta-galactosidase
MPTRAAPWREASLNRTVMAVEVTQPSASQVQIVVDFELSTPPASQARVRYVLVGSGELMVEQTLTPGALLPDIPAVGMRMRLPAEFDTLRWFGRGPHESYWDRKTGAFLGVYESSVDDRFFPYIQPQETGNATDVRWASLTNASGRGIAMVAWPAVEVNALFYSDEELERRLHPYELERDSAIVLRVNHRQMGVGGDNSWGARPHAEYRLPSLETYTYRYRLIPLSDSRALPTQLKRYELPWP